ncbi:MAG: RHS repeat-associated core domain-containing protein [Candidatus Koribacter versatilis]|uniref:RHS repeat-associated core domain-containing protein n=1 Tax=Candidatus Korobacter versatilis TaxID=658062 RepID=A0A932A9N8_9BACT|nr:RHS repeat-associated core domain-containing protein [Candidatus Koribacter versatilis]
MYRTFGHFPYGETWYETGAASRQKFTTYERDGESGLDYAIMRSYSSTLGRFSAPDPLAGSVGNPQSLDRYTYVESDPIDSIDPLGLWKRGPALCPPKAGPDTGGIGSAMGGHGFDTPKPAPINECGPRANGKITPCVDLTDPGPPILKHKGKNCDRIEEVALANDRAAKEAAVDTFVQDFKWGEIGLFITGCAGGAVAVAETADDQLAPYLACPLMGGATALVGAPLNAAASGIHGAAVFYKNEVKGIIDTTKQAYECSK